MQSELHELLNIGLMETLVIMVRHPKHVNNEIEGSEADRVIAQGKRLVEAGLDPKKVAASMATPQLRSVHTAVFLREGIGVASAPYIVNPNLNSIEEFGAENAKAFKAAAKDAGIKPWEALSERRGQQLVAEAGIADRLFRAVRASTAWVTLAQAHQGSAVIISDHNGNDIEPGIAYLKSLADEKPVYQVDDLPDPERYVQEAGIVLMKIGGAGVLIGLCYLDA